MYNNVEERNIEHLSMIIGRKGGKNYVLDLHCYRCDRAHFINYFHGVFIYQSGSG